MDVDRAGPAVVLVAPDPRQQRLTGEDLAGVGGEELEQLVLHVGEVERPPADRRLVGLEVDDEVAVLHDFGPGRPAGPPGQQPQPGLQLLGVERREAEVVEKVFPQFEITQLVARHQYEDRLNRYVPSPQRAADDECALGVALGGDHGPRPTVGRFQLGRDRGVGHRLPGIPG